MKQKASIGVLIFLIMLPIMIFGVHAATDAVQSPDAIVDGANDWITWGMVASYAGMVAVTAAVTQIVKGLPLTLNDTLDPKWYSLIVSLVLSLGVQFLYRHDMSAQGIFMMFLNWIVVYGSAVGGYETIIKPIERNMR